MRACLKTMIPENLPESFRIENLDVKLNMA